MYTLILQNNASKQTYVFRSLLNCSDNDLYYEFEPFKMPEKCGLGEYSYFLIKDEHPEDVEFKLKEVVLDSDVIYKGNRICSLRQLYPETGLMKYVTDSEEPQFRANDTERKYYYREK